MVFNDIYIREKAEKAKRHAQDIINALDRDNASSVSYIVDAILGIEDALGSLHVGARQLMERSGENERDFMLRNLGTVVKGK
jgi:hypothetical protein